MSEESLADRLTEEVTSLSTKLVTAVSKQSELEEKLLHYHKDNNQLRATLSGLNGIDHKYNQLKNEFEDLQGKYNKNYDVKNEAEAENKRLKAEVEDLTASLFDEANKMVSDASRETYNFKVKNRKLYEEIDEKNLIIDNLQSQLVDLKKMLEGLEQENQSIKHNDKASNHLIDSDEDKFINCSVFSPKLKGVRYDLEAFNDFRDFLTVIIGHEFSFDLNNLKLTKYFKKVWVEELENSIPLIPSSNFLNRWQKGKSFWNLLIEGKIKIEPIKGVNETLKLDYTGDESNQVPIATKDGCSFCGEQRNDNLEHSRLHSLKLLNPNPMTNVENEYIGNYPLCNYCLIKIRNICEFFAKMRLINKNYYKITLPMNKSNIENECKILKLYLILVFIRSKIFWSKVGYWDNINEISSINIDEISLDHFKLLLIPEDNESVKSNEAVKSEGEGENQEGEESPKKIQESSKKEVETPKKEVETPKKEVETLKKEVETPKKEVETPKKVEQTPKKTEQTPKKTEQTPIKTEQTQKVQETSNLEKSEDLDPLSKDLKSQSQSNQNTQPESKSKTKKKKAKAKANSRAESETKAEETKIEEAKDTKSSNSTPIKDRIKMFNESQPVESGRSLRKQSTKSEKSEDDEFEDSSDKLERKNSTSKQFTTKVNNDLDNTLQMLQESIDKP